jgi:hypothetical protein
MKARRCALYALCLVPCQHCFIQSAAYVHLLNSDAIKRLVFKAARESREEDRNGPEEGEATALELEDLEVMITYFCARRLC